MTVFRVWAPKAERVDVQLGAREGTANRTPMQRGEHGWWSVDIPRAGPGTTYWFVRDGGEPMPDPRSAYQPRGPFGPSQVVDQDAFGWTDHGFQAPPLSSGVLYELHIGTFTPEGTFESAISRLDHLKDLGVTHIELMPVAEFAGTRNWGYDGVDLFAPESAYGGPEGLKRFVDGAHAKGLAVILDVVYNHFGPSGNYTTQFGPYVTERYHTPWGQGVNLDDHGSDDVRRFFLDNALMWLRDYHFDGLRLDAVQELYDQSALHFLEELSREVKALEAREGRHLVVTAESDLNNPRLVRAWEAGGYGLDAHWLDDFRHALHTVLTGEQNGFHADFGRLADLADSLRHAYVYDGRYSQYRSRRHGRPVEGLPGSRFVGFVENHDQVGNRARGERAAALMSPGRFKVAMTLLFTAPFVPMLFQGEEWGTRSPFLFFTDHEDPELARAVSEGRRREFAAFGWTDIPDPQDPATFERSKVNWGEMRQPPYADLLDWTKRLIALRRATSELRDGNLTRVDVTFDEGNRWLVMRRNDVRVAVNLADHVQRVPLPGSDESTLLLASELRVELVHDAIALPADSIAIVAG
ncbi:MAG TPA: malto-oligosyltrehalose trehalohydrolase [Ktedonobacterales bacterium]